jgi:spermidine synthase
MSIFDTLPIASSGRKISMSPFLFAGIGFQALVSQILLLREIMVVVAGHEMALGLMMASWLVGVFFGAIMATRAERRKKESFWPLGILFLCQLPLTFLVVVGLRHARFLFPVPPGAPLAASWAASLIIASLFPIGATSGAMFPMASRLARGFREGQAKAIAKVYFWDAAGSLVAGLVVPLLLIPRVENLLVLAYCAVISSLLGTLGSSPWGKRWSLASTVAGGAWLVLICTGEIQELDSWSTAQRWLSRKTAMERVAGVDSPYQSLELGFAEGQYTLLGNGRPLGVFPDPSGAMSLVGILMSQRQRPKTVLFLGGGPSSALPLLLQAGVEKLTIVELDPAVYSLSQRFLPEEIKSALRDPRVELLVGDGRSVLKGFPQGSFDAALVEMPDPGTTLLNRFHSFEFFSALRRVLRLPGLVIHGVTGSSDYIGPELEHFLGTLHATMREVFGEVRVIPGERTLFIASLEPGTVSLDPENLSFFSRGIWGSEGLPPGLFETWIQPFQAENWQRVLAQGSYPINTDEHPRATLAFLCLWERLSGTSFGASLLERISGIPWSFILIAWCTVGCISLLVGMGSGLTRGVLLTIGVTGATAMAQEMICLYLYQTVWGHLYSKVGLLMGMFMAGLSVGAWLASLPGFFRWEVASKALIGVQGGLALLCVSIPTLWVPSLLGTSFPERPPWWQGDVAFCLWMLIAGALTGATFPLGCRLMERDLTGTARIAGVASAWDHLGAAIGALAAGVILAPAMGLKAAGAVVAGLQIFALGSLCFMVLALGKREG